MDNNKRHNILQMGLAMLLFSIMGINPCYADDPDEINDPAEIEGVFFQAKFIGRYLHPIFARIDENVFRLIIYAPKSCGKPTFTLFDKKGGSPYENQDTQLKSDPESSSNIQWVITNTIKNTTNTVHPEFYTITFDRNSRDPRCWATNIDVSNIEISPYIFPKGDGSKKFTIKNNHYQEILIAGIWDVDNKQRYVILPELSEPIRLLPGETHIFELQPGTCPARSAPEVQVEYYFSGKNMVTGNSMEFSIMVEISCIRELERANRARDEATKDRDAALSALEALKLEMAAVKKAAELEKAAAIKTEGDKVQTDCEAACIETRKEDREVCNAQKSKILKDKKCNTETNEIKDKEEI